MSSDFGLVGNGRVLARVHADGSLTEAFFPSIGCQRHILQSQLGIYLARAGRAYWLSHAEFKGEQRYLPDTNVLEATFTRAGLRCRLTDFAHPELDVLVRRLELENTGSEPEELALFHMEAAALEENKGNFGHNVAYYHPERGTVTRYRGHAWDNTREARTVLLVAGAPVPDEAQCGRSYLREGPAQDAFLDVADGALQGHHQVATDAIGATSALLWRRTLAPGEKTRASVLLVFGTDLLAAEETLAKATARGPERLLEETVAYWRGWLETGRRSLPDVPEEPWRRLYLRSLLFLKLIQDARSGALIAAPNLYPDYRYCWPRDAVYIAWAFDRCGYHEEARRFYRWCARTQLAEGYWAQNYYTDGRRHWTSIQVDQVGTILWGLRRHLRLTEDAEFREATWPMVERAAGYLLKRVDPDLGLVSSEQDLWEETSGHLLYTNAASAAGLRAAAALARELGLGEQATAWRKAARGLSRALRERLLQDGIFVGEVEPNRSFPAREDYLLDVSSLGAAVPFRVVRARQEELGATAARLAEAMRYPVGGVGRYPSDLFVGGNPWSLAAIWLALVHAARGETDAARRQLEWCVEHAARHGFLPEQIDKRSGHPAAAHPLGWSHAWLIVALQRLSGELGVGSEA